MKFLLRPAVIGSEPEKVIRMHWSDVEIYEFERLPMSQVSA